jgi:hypothetical protein
VTHGSVRLRRLLLTSHVIFSVGWLGAVLAVLGLSVAGLASSDTAVTRAAYLAMQPVARYVLIPLSLASFFSGIVQSLVSVWGLFRHYWVILKLIINVTAVAILFLYLQTVDYLAAIARAPAAPSADSSPLVHSLAALLALVAATALSIYKPKGMTKYGQRRQRHERRVAAG